MPYSYSEDHQKSLTVIDMDPSGTSAVSLIDLDMSRGVRTIKGTIDDLLDPTRHPEAHERFVRAIITNRETVLDAKAKLERVYPYITEIRPEPEGGPVTAVGGPRITVNELQPIDAVTEFWTELEGSAPEDELLEILTGAVDTAQRNQS